MLKHLALAVLILLPLSVQAQDKLPVVASFSVLGDMVRQIGAEDAPLVPLVGPDGDPHVYQPSPGDARKLAAARLFVVNGLGLEGWMPRLIASANFKGVVVTTTAG